MESNALFLRVRAQKIYKFSLSNSESSFLFPQFALLDEELVAIVVLPQISIALGGDVDGRAADEHP
jgi:hypothetical protein